MQLCPTPHGALAEHVPPASAWHFLQLRTSCGEQHVAEGVHAVVEADDAQLARRDQVVALGVAVAQAREVDVVDQHEKSIG